MTDFFAFASEHPFLTWLLAWGIWPVTWAAQHILTFPFSLAFKAYNRHLRARNIRRHGWPVNKLMDADGDIIHPAPAAETKPADKAKSFGASVIETQFKRMHDRG